MKRFVISIIILTTIASCGDLIKFDSKKWKIEEDLEFYPYREEMLNDIIDNKLFIGMSYTEAIDSLGKPNNYGNSDSTKLYYTIVVDYGKNIDPVYTKHLVLKMNQDSIISEMKILEFNH